MVLYLMVDIINPLDQKPKQKKRWKQLL